VEVRLGRVPVLVVMGVSGSGKSTVSAALAARLHWDYVDADDLHPAHNVELMAAGHALTDDDRAPWLDRVAQTLRDFQGRGRSCVLACSALKRRYRDVLRGDGVVFVHLVVDPAGAAARVAGRPAHFMPAALVDSQFAALERLDDDENGLTIDATEPVDDVVQEILDRLDLDSYSAPAS
jgi:carbohydrate kinase (thermoresistant glucokinase family)